MKVTKFMKGLLAAALAVTMAVTPAASVKAAEVTVTSGASTYTFSEMPIAAFEVTGLRNHPVILYCLPKGTQIHSQAGSSLWKSYGYANYMGGINDKFEVFSSDYEGPAFMECPTEEGQNRYYQEVADYNAGIRTDMGSGGIYNKLGEIVMDKIYEWGPDGEVCAESDEFFPGISFFEIYHEDVPGVDAIYLLQIGDEDISLIPAAFACTGMTAVQIPVETALAMDNANFQNNPATQPAADAQSAQQTAAQAQAEAQAATQTQITSQQTSVSQGTYIVEAGDNLCKIAQKVYGDMKAWREIYNANSNAVKSDYVIYKGQVLVIPAR